MLGSRKIDVTTGAVDLLSFAVRVRHMLGVTANSDDLIPPAGRTDPNASDRLAVDWAAWWMGLLAATAGDVGTLRNGIDVTVEEAIASLDQWDRLRTSVLPIAADALDWATSERRALGEQARRADLALAATRFIEAAVGQRRPWILTRGSSASARIAFLPGVGIWLRTVRPSLVLVGAGMLDDPTAVIYGVNGALWDLFDPRATDAG